MDNNNERIMVEHLRHIRGRVDQISSDMTELRHRITVLEHSMNIVKREVNLGSEVSTNQQSFIDRLIERMQTLERRLDVIQKRASGKSAKSRQ
ncbi:MAG: hypothetical protein AAF512_09785 [Pseudomonadota bacterium]